MLTGSDCEAVLDGISGTPFEAGWASGGAEIGSGAVDMGSSCDITLASACGGSNRASNCG